MISFAASCDRGERVVRIDAPLEAIRRIGLHAEAPRRAADDGRLEPGALEQDVRRRVADLALGAADDAAEADGALRVGDDDRVADR